jgi:phage shock protein C
MRDGLFDWFPAELYRDPEHGRVAGVCIGLGRYFSIRPKIIRIGFIVGSVFGLFVPLAILYGALTLLMPPVEPGASFGAPDPVVRRWERWSFEVGTDGTRTARGAAEAEAQVTRLAEYFRTLDQRLGKIEAKVTSDEFVLRQKFREL